jgi:UDP-2-acetamido-3-amino-2,3-dideoxy-glucuronate N-acetyltransferase
MGQEAPRVKKPSAAKTLKAAKVHPSALVDPAASLGAGTKVWAFAQIREKARIGRNCVISNGAYVDTGVRVGDRCNIHNRALLYRNLVLEQDVFVGPAAAFLNDPAPRANRIRDIRGEVTVVRRGASIGAAAQILPDLRIGRFAMVASGSVVTRDVPDHALVAGVPARVKGFVDPAGEKLAVTAMAPSHVTLANANKTFKLRITRKAYDQVFQVRPV